MKDRQEGALSGAQNRAAERIVREVKEDFSKRQAERRLIERGWELSMNFLAGNQYCGSQFFCVHFFTDCFESVFRFSFNMLRSIMSAMYF